MDHNQKRVELGKKRMEWLSAHPEVWHLDREVLFKKMKEIGIIAPLTNFWDCKIDKWIDKARMMRREIEHQGFRTCQAARGGSTQVDFRETETT